MYLYLLVLRNSLPTIFPYPADSCLLSRLPLLKPGNAPSEAGPHPKLGDVGLPATWSLLSSSSPSTSGVCSGSGSGSGSGFAIGPQTTGKRTSAPPATGRSHLACAQ
ncbi:hypothetical protein EJ02DRAFT_516775 [Clathrospora elynae]|uniref:Uncharacterized protein n=1 Tax=Clathrospora elynae TaxID=706981 RepID=A0A6A5S2D6_9PLEO|nr:hypothetical protein EJ02DRAFT_516775 [Clathrospora elynae]